MVSSGAKRSVDQGSDSGLQVEGDAHTNAPKKRCDAQAASQRHIKTEQARRDKISAGFQALQDLLPGREKVEKAMLLGQAAEYICQLQGVLQMLMSSGSINKLPDSLQWQIRTLLPRKDGKPHPVNPTLEQVPTDPGTQQGFVAPHCPSPINLAASMQLPTLPMVSQPSMGENKELPKEEGALYAQVQALLHQQQQQAVAAQQIQNWQQTLQALQLQQVMAQQQGQIMPELVNSLCGYGSLPAPLGSLPLQTAQSNNAGGQLSLMGPCDPQVGTNEPRRAEKDPAKCFADDLPRCGLQQLVDVACENSLPTGRGPHQASPHKARKSSVKVRRHTTAARIPKPQGPNPTLVGPGRPEPV